MEPMAEQPSEPPAEQPSEPASEQVDLLLRDLRSTREGLTSREAQRRLLQYGPNQLHRHGGARWPGELLRQITHPLALLLWVASALSFAVGNETVGIAVLLVIVLNAAFAFLQELEAERAVEALASYLPPHARAIRDGEPQTVPASDLVPGDIVLVQEGDRVAADMRIIGGAVEVDLSTLTGESAPALCSATLIDRDVPRLAARDLLFSGTTCNEGEAIGVVFATGMRTELGRIAALSQRVKEQPSPLERQVRRVAWLIAGIAVAMAIAFVPIAIFGAGLSVKNSVVFAVGLLAGNVPEGLLPAITLALAVAVTLLARRGALVKRLSSVETLGGTDVICTDKTGTLTVNEMRPVSAWTRAGEIGLQAARVPQSTAAPFSALAETAVACNNAQLTQAQAQAAPAGAGEYPNASGDPTEIALLIAAQRLGRKPDTGAFRARRAATYHFDPRRKLMSTIDPSSHGSVLHTKGAPEALLPHCSTILAVDGSQAPLSAAEREAVSERVSRFAQGGLRVLALARRGLPSGTPPPQEQAERDLCLLGLVTMMDPPRAEVSAAVADCHRAGIRIIVITGDHPLTATAIAAQVGIGGSEGPLAIDASDIDHARRREMAEALAGGREIVFSRASPEAKLHIAEELRSQGHTVAMTGDGVNDAPALRAADIGVAMGKSGTDVAREASTMVLTDDNFATIVTAVESGRRVYANVRKFIVYIFAHATPEIVPFVVFALGGGLIPLPLSVIQLLAFDVGTETLPSLALARDPAEPDSMARPPRRRSESVIQVPMLLRAWLFLGVLVAALSLGGYFYVLNGAGWRPGAPTGVGHPLHHAYLQATTMTFLGMIVGQIGTAFAVRTQRASLWSIGVLSNRYLLVAIAAELAIAALFVYAPPFQSLLGTASLPLRDLAILPAYPLIVWGADELRRWILRKRAPIRSFPQTSQEFLPSRPGGHTTM
jgi:calcium-translocating P-type ATPase